jgi:hypothetical protein
MLSVRHKQLHTPDMNCVPLSVVTLAGTPKHAIHPEVKASAHSTPEIERSGTTSGHLVVLSMIVSRCV